MKFLAAAFLGLMAFVVLECTVLLELVRHLGLLYTLLLVFGAGIVGAFIARMEGFRILFRIQDSLRSGIVPADELLDGLLVLFAALLFVLPGFLSDIAGIILLLPPTRFPVKIWMRRTIRRWFLTRTLRVTV